MATELIFVRGRTPCDVIAARIPRRTERLSGLQGFLVPATHRDQLLTELGWDQAAVEELITSAWGVTEIRLKTNAEPEHAPTVRMAWTEEPSPAWQAYLQCVERWCAEHATELPYPVVIHYTSGTHQLGEHGQLHLCFGGHANFPVRVWAHQRDVYYQSAHLWWGELGPEHELCRALIPTLLGEFVPRMTGTVPLDGADAFVKTLLTESDTNVGDLRERIDTLERDITRLQRELVKKTRELTHAQQELDMRVERAHTRREHLRRQYTSLARRPYVRGIHAWPEVVSIIVDHVTIDMGDAGTDGRMYDIGAFRIDLWTSGGEGCVTLTNLTRRGPNPRGYAGGFHHPHVNDEGKPCLGTIMSSLPRLIGRGEYAAACDLLVNFLRAASLKDAWGRNIERWPCFQPAEPTGGSL